MSQLAKFSREVDSILKSLPTIANDGQTAAMLPRQCYTSSEFFQFERTAVLARSWTCVGHEHQIPKPGDYLAPNVAGEPLIVVRTADGSVHAMTAVCQHRGQIVACEPGSAARSFRCPLHFWTYDLNGRLLGAPRMDDIDKLRKKIRLPPVRLEIWHGFLFVNLNQNAPPLAPSLAKLEPFWAGYEDADLKAVPPAALDKPLPWNWKVHAENFTDAYHPEFVHVGTHDFAPSVHPDGGVEFTSFKPGDNAIVRSVPLLRPDGGMMADGWGEKAMFPAIQSLSPKQRKRLTFALLPPSMTLVFAPGAVAYQLMSPVAVDATMASNDRVTAGGWLLPKSTIELPDFNDRTKVVQEGARKIWLQDIPVNNGVQVGKRSRFMPTIEEDLYNKLETTLLQFNAWLVNSYQDGWQHAS
ncbi:MAG TPA: aromatic ring-hydroxylating dioxygenase subunit alpha [Lacipirellulaceae bacterium]|nr:aromatic ring-hydroxylating dioxygenase subunit alpha [Lacipirellulaceae bacterium]